MIRHLTQLIAGSFLALLLVGPAVTWAQSEQVTMEDLQQMLQDQKDMLEQQQKLIQQQGEQLAATQKAMAALQSQIDQMKLAAGQATDVDASDQVAAHKSGPEDLKEEELRRQDSPEQESAAGYFPGSVPIPGTSMSAKVGGYVRLGLVDSFDPIGSDDRFIVGSIPVGEPVPGRDFEGFTISAKRSRVNLDMRMNSDVGTFRAFIEGDFAADIENNDTYRLRHAFGQYKNWIMGQTWSTFMDTEASPEELDFEGLNAYINDRQPILRYTTQISKRRVFAVALENPASEITGGDGKGKFADLATRISKTREWGHVQAALLLRNISGAPTDDPENASSTFGWGFSLSGSNRFKRWSQQDNFRYQFNIGKGIGRYINDLNSVGGQDAVFDPAGDLKVLPAMGAFLAYQHYWKRDPTSFFARTGILKELRSTLVFGYTQVDNYDFQADDAYRRTKRVTLNLVWSPITAIDLGFELLWGERMNKDGERGNASQFQLVGTFYF
ncbi:MAG: DcaP family trimeric outer membrane transporter [Thermoanaerobaculia bacterium]